MINISEQVKSRERVSAHGEVFTAEREVKAMCDLVDDECRRYDSTFLEPACGDGNFLAEILTRKLSSIHDDPDYERKSLIALSSLYGIDILPDNADLCRRRLYEIWNTAPNLSESARTRAREILSSNIVNGDTLQPETIIFTEWVFPENSITPERKEFSLRGMIYEAEQKLSEKERGQIGIIFETE